MAGPDRRGLWRLAGAILAAGALGGCGFRPLYGEAEGAAGSVQDRLAEVNVLLIPERSGQLLREALQARLDRSRPAVARRYDLSVQYAIAQEGIAIQRDNSTSRLRLVATAQWTLLAQDGRRTTVANGSAREVDAFNIINQQFFAADLANQAAQRRLADAVAEQVVLQLANHFSRVAAR